MLAEIIHPLAGMESHESAYKPRPSSAGPEKCTRQMVYHGLDFPRTPLPGRAVVIFSDSSFHEELTFDWLRKSAFKIHSEQMEVQCRPPMKKGRIDCIATDVLGVDRLVEHKAINHFTFERIWNGELPLDNFAQCCVYMDGIQTTLNPDLREFILLIKNKNTSAYIEFLCDYSIVHAGTTDRMTILSITNSNGEVKHVKDEKDFGNLYIDGLVAESVDKFLYIDACIKDKVLPKRDYDIDHWRCEYCGWFKTCWKDIQKEFA